MTSQAAFASMARCMNAALLMTGKYSGISHKALIVQIKLVFTNVTKLILVKYIYASICYDL